MKKEWKVVDHPVYPGMLVIEGPVSPITIITFATDIDFESYSRRIADANLIAAAPDLLEALRNLENDAGQIPDHAWRLVKSAIAKATGAEQ